MRVCFELCGSCLLLVSVLSWGADPRMANLGHADPLVLKVPLESLHLAFAFSNLLLLSGVFQELESASSGYSFSSDAAVRKTASAGEFLS